MHINPSGLHVGSDHVDDNVDGRLSSEARANNFGGSFAESGAETVDIEAAFCFLLLDDQIINRRRQFVLSSQPVFAGGESESGTLQCRLLDEIATFVHQTSNRENALHAQDASFVD